MERPNELRDRLQRMTGFTLRNEKLPQGPKAAQMNANATIEMGWGRIIFGHTFRSQKTLCAAMERETAGKRDITFYLRDPHVLLAMGPDRFFLRGVAYSTVSYAPLYIDKRVALVGAAGHQARPR